MCINEFIKQFESMNKETQEITKNQILEYFSKKDNLELFKKIKIYIDNTIKLSIISIITNNIEINNTHKNIEHSNKKNIIKYIIKLLDTLNIDIKNVFEILNNNTLYELRQKKIILQLIKTEIINHGFTYDVKKLNNSIEIDFTIIFDNIEYNFNFFGDTEGEGKETSNYFFKNNFNNEYNYIIEQIFQIDYLFGVCFEWSNEYKQYNFNE